MDQTCLCCKKTYKINLDEPIYEDWQQGRVPLSKLAPHLTSEEWDMLIFQICTKCWEKIEQGTMPTPEEPQVS